MPVEPQRLVSEFAAAVQSQSECIRAHAAARGNRFAEAYIAAGQALLNGGEPAIDAFATLLRHDDDEVRVMAAAFLMAARTEAAVTTLEPIAAGAGLAALGARITLERYRRGDLNLRFD